MLDLIQRGGATSRAQIARESGLSKPTVSLALGSLVDAGLVHEVGRASGGKGPSAVLYELNPQAGWVVGIDVGAHWLRAAVADITGKIVARLDERARARSSEALVRQIGDVAHRVASEAGLRWRQITHATVGSSGVLDPSRGLLAHAPNLPGWGRQGLVGAIREQLGTAVSFENDVNLAALGERSHGAGRGVDNFAFLWVGTGVGMGIVIAGELYRGAGGAAGEIGYMPIGTGDPSDPRFRRRGMLEEWAGASAVTGAARATGLRQAAKGIFAAARRGDARAAAVVEEEAGRIAVAIAGVAPVLDPELIVLGGGIGGNPDLLPAVDRRLRAISPFAPRLATSQLGDEAVLHGAVVTALESARDQLFTRKPLSRTAVV
ncbi:MAG TPA: ROK family transcriptional regulator [Gaiellales bacterium]|nr:ROK family transcriptional regulator [Gaiellales bacterium]